MALKPDRVESYTDVSYFMDTVGERGGIVVHLNSGTGASMDDGNAVVTRQHINWYRDEVQVGGKVTLLRQGQVVTNMLATGQTPAAGTDAYYDAAGKLTTVSTNSTKVGRFLGSKDSDGYVKVDINIT